MAIIKNTLRYQCGDLHTAKSIGASSAMAAGFEQSW
jgi:hypothetical protein